MGRKHKSNVSTVKAVLKCSLQRGGKDWLRHLPSSRYFKGDIYP